MLVDWLGSWSRDCNGVLYLEGGVLKRWIEFLDLDGSTGMMDEALDEFDEESE